MGIYHVENIQLKKKILYKDVHGSLVGDNKMMAVITVQQ